MKLEQGGRDFKEWHPILTTDYFEYGTTKNRLDKEGCGVEMGDAALGLARSLAASPGTAALLLQLQRELFVVGADLATNPRERGKLKPGAACCWSLTRRRTWAIW